MRQLFVLGAGALALALAVAPSHGAGAAPQADHYRAHLKPPASLAAILQHVEPGADAFPEEKTAAAIAARLGELGRLLRTRGARDWARLLAPDFKGARLQPTDSVTVAKGALEIVRAKALASDLALDRAAFGSELGALAAGMDEVRVAEFLVTRIEQPSPAEALSEVRFDVVGSGAAAYRTERVGRFRIGWRRDAAGLWQATSWLALAWQQSRAAAPVFREVTGAALGANESFRRQLAFPLDPWLATLDSVFMLVSMGHHGVSAGDFDGDGLDDLFVAQPAGLPDRLFRNRGDFTFEDVTERAGLMVLDETSQALFADVDNDGDQDLVLVVTGAGLLLFRNDGAGHFTLDRDAFHLKLQGTPMSIAMADYDKDGFLDIYLCTYSYFIGTSEDKGGAPNPYHDAQNGPPNLLLKNDHGRRFVDVTAEAGLDANNSRFSFAAAWGDYDGDGWPDLLVANDFGRKNLYHNEGLQGGKVRFRDVTAAAGVEDHGAGMSATWLDYDGDGRLDAYTGNMWSANGQRVTSEPGFMKDASAEIKALYRRHARGNSLFRNAGDGRFEDVTLAARAEMGRWAWSSDSLDFDRDGAPDLYVVNGMFTREPDEDLDGFFWRQVVARSPLTRVTGTPYDDAWRAINRLLADKSQASHQRNDFLRNDGAGGFDEVAGSLGLDLDQDGRSFAVSDLDGDGAPDLAVMAARSAPQLRLFRNEFKDPRAALAVRLRGTKSNRDAVGARVTVETDRMRRTLYVTAGSGFISQHSKELLFGLGDSTKIAKLEVRWPSGETQTLDDVPLNRRMSLDEGGTPRFEPFRAIAAPAERSASVAPATDGPPGATWLYERYPAPDVGLTDLAGKPLSLASLRGRPAFVLLWSASSEVSVKALSDLSRERERLEQAGARLLAVSLDPKEEVANVRAAADAAQGLALGIGSEELGATCTLLNRHLLVTKEDLRLPTLFLLDAAGEIVRLYRAPIDAGALAADLKAIDATPAERLRRAFPFPGTFYSKPAERNSLQLGLELVEQGIEGPALVAFERAARGTPNAFTLYSLGTLYMKGGQNDKARDAFERALALKADFAEASNGLGVLAGQGGDLPGAVARFQKALQATPDYPDALDNLGYAFLQSNRDAEAYELFQKALKLSPDLAEAWNNLGIHAAKQGDPPQAEARFKKAVELRPGYGEAANNLALVLVARGDVAGAEAALQKVLEQNPGFAMSYVTLAKVYLSTGRAREATQVLERLLQREPQNPLALSMLQQLKSGR